MPRTIVNLEDPKLEDADVVVQYRGVMVRLDKRRILELVELEERWLRSASTAELPGTSQQKPVEDRPASTGGKAAHAPAAVAVPARTANVSDDVGPGPVSHASLSYRIKRVYNYSKGSRALRETHRGLILELIERFDWQIPDHPNSQLDFHLKEILDWLGGRDQLAEARIRAFLAKYQDRRYRAEGA